MLTGAIDPDAGSPDPRRILYVQYTNPAGYPPLEHSSRILADRGWHVRFLGTGALGSNALRFPPHAQITVRQMPFQPAGWRQKLHYLRYCAWVFSSALRWRTHWVYASDALSSLPALLVSRLPGVRVLYHEHDSPTKGARMQGLQRLWLVTRQQLAQRAALCVLPNQQRAAQFIEDTGADPQRTYCVWNCPRLEEVSPPRTSLEPGRLRVLYHGSIVPHRPPITIIDALAQLPDTVELHVIGYETIGSLGYSAQLRAHAQRLGVADRLTFLPAIPRSDLLPVCRTYDVGLAFIQLSSTDINLTALIGASNKVFDYLASGLALLVTDLPEWRAAYAAPGYGLACDPESPASIAKALRFMLEHPAECRAMGERGRQKVLAEWNYERQFAPVIACLEQLT